MEDGSGLSPPTPVGCDDGDKWSLPEYIWKKDPGFIGPKADIIAEALFKEINIKL